MILNNNNNKQNKNKDKQGVLPPLSQLHGLSGAVQLSQKEPL